MAVILKSRHQIEMLRHAGHIVAETFDMLSSYIKPGITTAELDEITETYIRKRGAVPAFKGYGALPARNGNPPRPPFPASICVSLNDVICHGIPSPRKRLRQGDIISIDIGLFYKGWVGDACYTFKVGQVSEKAQHLIDTTEKCLALGIEQARPGNHLGDIGAAIEHHAHAQGFSVVREYTGHGIGRKLHEDPTVLHYGKKGTGMRLRPGMVFTIEPMINIGRPETRLLNDGWTVHTNDGSLSAQFEHAIAITDDEPLILTQ